MHNNISPLSIKKILQHLAKYIVCCFFIGSLILVSGCSAHDTAEPGIDSTVNTSSASGTGQNSNVSSSVTSDSDVAQSPNIDQTQDTDETCFTIKEILDLITPLHMLAFY